MPSEGESWGEEGYGVADGAHTQDSDQQVEHIALDSHSSGDAADDGSDDAYDPESVTIDTSSSIPNEPSSANPSQLPAAKPKMSGGFLVEASDDEDDETSQPEVNTQSNTPVINLNNGPPPVTETTDPTPSYVPPVFAGIDPVALLEARIKEDPRGDMDAWLNLIADHKRRNNSEALRTTYDRFVEVFPQAVGPSDIRSF